jgi:hypothetical protein
MFQLQPVATGRSVDLIHFNFIVLGTLAACTVPLTVVRVNEILCDTVRCDEV